MSKKILPSLFSGFFLLLVTSGLSQDYDLIVTTKGDSVICRIDSITETHIYFEMKSQNKWAHTHIGLTDVSEYKRNAIDKKQFVFKSGSSIIESPKQLPHASMHELQKNSVYIGILSINYSRMISWDRVGLTVSGGLSFITTLAENGVGLMAETTLLTGGTKHFFEPGILLYFDPSDIWPAIRTGYRYQGPEGLMFRIAALWVISEDFPDLFFLPGLSIGYSF